jgi:hypothetical protein
LLQQLFHIKHTTTITDYIEKFTDLFEQLKAYNPNPDKLYFTTRFIDGLRKDIRSVVLVARPQDLDSACTLALLQEEALDQGGCKEFKCSEASPFSRTATIKGALPLPPPPRRPPAPLATVDDKRATPSIHPLMTSSPRCGPTVELVAFAFDVVTNGLQAIVVLRFLRYMHSKRYGTFMQMLFKKVLLLNLLKKSKLPLNKHLCCCRRLLSLVLLLQEQCSCKAPCLDVISAF